MNKKVLLYIVLLVGLLSFSKIVLGATATTKTTIPLAPKVVSTSPATSTIPLFTRNLSLGSTGADVTALQKWLLTIPGVYPKGQVTGYFGSATREAVKKYQILYKIASSGTEATTGFGMVGTKTRVTLNAQISNSPNAKTLTTTATTTPEVIKKEITVKNLDASSGIVSSITNFFDGVIGNITYSGSQQKPNYPAPAHGEEVVYNVSAPSSDVVKFSSVDINPLVAYPGDRQTMKVTLTSPNPISSVSAVTTLDTKILTLNLVNDGTGANTWTATWIVNDTSVRVYRTTFTATDSAGNVGTTNFAWSDPCTGFTDGADATLNQTTCTVGSDLANPIADGVDGGNIIIPAGKAIVLNPGTTFAYNPGKSITKYGTITKASGAIITKGYLYYPDPLNTGTYTTSKVSKTFSANSTLTNYIKAALVTGVYCDGSTTTAPGATRTKYGLSAVSCGNASVSELQTCLSTGTWNLSNYSSVTPLTASTRTGYTTSSVACGSSCTTQGQTCQSNGLWDGTAIGSCSVTPASTWYLDADGDGYYPNASPPVTQCNTPGAGWSTTVKTSGDCDDSTGTIIPGSTRTRWKTTASACSGAGQSCASETQTCTAGSWTVTAGFTETSACSASTRTMYSSTSVACGSVCTSIQETQTCQVGGAWSGTYANAACSPIAQQTWYLDADGDGYYPNANPPVTQCNSPGAGWSTTVKTSGDCDDSTGTVIPGSTMTRYKTTSNACGAGNTSCQSEVRTCTAGSWTGTFSEVSSCAASATTRTMYSGTSVACGSVCSSIQEVQTCQYTGSWNGTYVNASCSPVAAQTWYQDTDLDGYYPNAYPPVAQCSAPTTPATGWSTTVKTSGDCDDSTGTVIPGSTMTRYKTTSNACGAGNTSCQSEVRTCTAGSWTGTFSEVSSCAASATTRTMYSPLSFAGCGIYSCPSETQTCQYTGSWNGSYASASCSVATRTGYTVSVPACGVACDPTSQQTQTCLVGGWNGTGIGSCSLATVPTWYKDSDLDGYYPNASPPVTQCSSPGAGWSTTVKTSGDCDDSVGGIIPGSTRTGYIASNSGCGTYSCSSAVQTCTAGAWTNPTYTATSCAVASLGGYTSSSVACGSSCTSATRYCQSNGTYSNFGSCSPTVNYTVGGACTTTNACGSAGGVWQDACSGNCSGNPTSSRTMWLASSSGCGIYACASESQSCSGGTWTGSYTATSCTVASTGRYISSSVACGGNCNDVSNLGVYNCLSSGSYGGYGSCSPATGAYTVGANCNQNACGTWGGTITDACSGACSGGVPATPYTLGATCNACGVINNACTGTCSRSLSSCRACSSPGYCVLDGSCASGTCGADGWCSYPGQCPY